jgi:hypothetical protein
METSIQFADEKRVCDKFLDGCRNPLPQDSKPKDSTHYHKDPYKISSDYRTNLINSDPLDYSEFQGNSELKITGIVTATRDSSSTTSADKQENAQPVVYKECRQAIWDIHANATVRWVRKFHKIGNSEDSILYSIDSEENMFSFDQIVKTLVDLSESVTEDHIDEVLIAIRHSLSLTCSGFHLRDFLNHLHLTLPSWFVPKLRLFVTGFFYSGNNLVVDPHILEVERLRKLLIIL